jgi:hypothetical protein
MEGTGSKLSSRRVAGRTAAALLTIGVLSVALSACGSGSSSNANGSPSSVVQKEAATSQVQLTVVNHAEEAVNNAFCRDQVFYSVLNKPELCSLSGVGPDETDSRTGNPVYGDIQWLASGTGRVYFEAHNPSVGQPSITLISATPPNDPIEKFTLGVGDTKETTVGSHDYSMHRGDDTDFIVMSITLTR